MPGYSEVSGDIKLAYSEFYLVFAQTGKVRLDGKPIPGALEHMHFGTCTQSHNASRPVNGNALQEEAVVRWNRRIPNERHWTGIRGRGGASDAFPQPCCLKKSARA
jgi:hypothetical protein